MNNAKKIGVFIFVFFIFFGPKIGKYVDTSILASIVMIFFVLKKRDHKIRVHAYTRDLVFFVGLILIYTICISVINFRFDVTFYGRTIRSIFSLLSISLFIYDSRHCKPDVINEVVINVLLIHAIIVLISALVFVDLQNTLRGFNGYQKAIRMYRSTGLMMGYDMSGLLCNLGFVLVLCKKKLNIIQFCIFFFAVIFTSRFSILFLIASVLLYLIVNNHNRDTIKRRALLLSMIIPIAVFGVTLMIVSTDVFSFLHLDVEKLFPPVYEFAMKVSRAYYNTEAESIIESRHFRIDSNAYSALFGTGFYGGADPGYTRFINCIGFVGLFLVIIWHFCAVKNAIKSNIYFDRLRYNRVFIILIFFMVLAGLNFKNSYFFTGTFFEFMMLQLFMFRFNDYYISRAYYPKCLRN